MRISNTAERLKKLMLEKNYRQVDILNKCEPYSQKYGVKLGRNDLSQYVNGKVEPGQEKLSILGMALGVSEAWLMGFDVAMEPKISGTMTNRELASISSMLRTDIDGQTLLHIYYDELSPENKIRLLDMARGLSGH